MQFGKKPVGLEMNNKKMPLWLAILISLIFAGLVSWGVFEGYKFYLRSTSMTTEQAESSSPEVRQSAEGRDERTIQQKLIDEYKVAADQPRVLTIPSINVKARILPMGVNPDNSMQAPINIFDSGWYTGSAKPGIRSGNQAAVIDAHASGPTREGLFAYLDTIAEGAEISIEMGNGDIIKYRVVAKETAELDKVDMNKLLANYSGVEEGLNLITCTGDWLKDKATFNKREIVYAERVKS